MPKTSLLPLPAEESLPGPQHSNQASRSPRLQLKWRIWYACKAMRSNEGKSEAWLYLLCEATAKTVNGSSCHIQNLNLNPTS